MFHVRSEIERYRIAKERKKAINVKSQGKWQVIHNSAIASSRPLFRAYDLLKCIQFVCLRSSSFGYKDTIEWRVVNQGKQYEILK